MSLCLFLSCEANSLKKVSNNQSWIHLPGSVDLRFLICETWSPLKPVCKTGQSGLIPFLAFTGEQVEEVVNRLIIHIESWCYLKGLWFVPVCVAPFVTALPTSAACLCLCQPTLSIVLITHCHALIILPATGSQLSCPTAMLKIQGWWSGLKQHSSPMCSHHSLSLALKQNLLTLFFSWVSHIQ